MSRWKITPHAITYALAALNDLDVKMADIENVYLTAPIYEKLWTVLGPESK
jgi:hypothetical protein